MAFPFTAEELLAYVSPNVTEGVDSTLLGTHIIPAAVALVEDLTGRGFAVASSTFIVDGDGSRVVGRYKEILLLPRGRTPLTAISPIVEDGVTLTKASGFDTTVEVITDATRFRLIRQNASNRLGVSRRGWAPGIQNIAIGLTAGYTEAALPKHIRLLLMEAAWLLFKNPVDLTKASKSKPGSSATLQKALTPLSLRTFNGLMLHGEPSA